MSVSIAAPEGYNRAAMSAASEPAVTRCEQLGLPALRALLEPLGLQIAAVTAAAAIPGSYWGDCEAGLIGNILHLRADTPVHSALHEACHWLCADPTRRDALHTDAGGDDIEENAVCYLQCLLAGRLSGYSRAQCFADMDAWGYHFLLGSAQAWFEQDAEDAVQRLRNIRPDLLVQA